MKARRAVHQLLPSLAEGDAIGNQVRVLQQLLVEWGFVSDIFASVTDRKSRGEARRAETLPRSLKDEDVVLVHHSIRSGFLPLLQRVAARKVVLYHNVTPGHFFEPYEPVVARECDAGRRELRGLAHVTDSAYAFTHYSAGELRAAGFQDVGVLPFPISWESFDARPDPVLADRLEDGRINVLYVGRVEPNKRVDEVIRVFTAFQRLFQPRSRLVLAGSFDPVRPYPRMVREVLRQLMPEEVLLLGKVSRAELSACFESAHAYLSMSAHEGFGVPLVEAMHRRVPVVAYGAAAVPETLGGAGICVLEDDAVTMSRALAVVTQDAEVRGRVLASQERRLEEISAQSNGDALRRAYLQAIEPTPATEQSHEA